MDHRVDHRGDFKHAPFHVTPDEHPARHATQLKPGCRREEAVGHKFGGPMKTVGLTCGRGNKTLGQTCGRGKTRSVTNLVTQSAAKPQLSEDL